MKNQPIAQRLDYGTPTVTKVLKYKIWFVPCYKWVENYPNIVHRERNMGFLKLDIYVAAASNI